ncbi:hypothetical protein C8Q75DRAFT_710785 [Abortiporus biennis]|nr:hypothetical protein C8Q75DRAFT_710785 [Abortiporus biennis]
MSGARLPAVRIPTIIPTQDDDELSTQEPILVDLPPSNKFVISWPAEAGAPISLPVLSERPSTLSSSDGETHESDQEQSVPLRRAERTEDLYGTEFVTPPDHFNLDQNPIHQLGHRPTIPRLTRAFSMPLPSQLGALQNPRRTSVSNETQSLASIQLSPDYGNFHELSLELADSVQMIIQTLLQLSPPQVLDPAKEQFAACSLSIPTPSICAMFTSMKNLNYMSANMTALSVDSPLPNSESNLGVMSSTQTDFDIGETLQSAGDALSGSAAQAGVDLVLFHGDVGMKHVAVKGDENGLSYALAHIVRQVIATCHRGDTVELGLFIEPVLPSTPDLEGDHRNSSSLPMGAEDRLRCTIHVAHRFSTADYASDSGCGLSRPQPVLNSLMLRRLLRHIGASIETDMKPKGFFLGRSCEVSLVLEPGTLSTIDSCTPVTPEVAAYIGYPDLRISQEPTLEHLTQFAESLRGKKATLHASPKGSFAHHLTSYLTAWGMDISHMSTEADSEGTYEGVADPVETHAMEENRSTQTSQDKPLPPSIPRPSSESPSLILIDDEVSVLRNRLEKVKAEQSYPLHLQSRKRPSLATNHRPRSSPHVARALGVNSSTTTPAPQVVIVHFTSLANYKLVKDVIQTTLIPMNGVSARVPEVIVIPKPAGPRRFLTALHTAVTKPIVDPFFIPIATSPISPGIHAMSPFFTMGGAPRSPSGRSALRTNSDRSTRSPKEYMGEPTNHAPSSPLGMSDGMEYFSDAAVKLGTSPSTGLVIQSPDGQPAGIFFHPKPKSSPNSDRQEGSSRSRGASFRGDVPFKGNFFVANSTPSSRPNPQSALSDSSASKGKTRQIFEDSAVDTTAPSPSPLSIDQTPHTRLGPRRASQNSATSPQSPQTRPSAKSTTSIRHIQGRSGFDGPLTSKSKKKGLGDSNILPPISVLIVDDNPINQTILSTFMKKKRIKYDVAKNGEEAVQKWRSGTFHLILMDIQMPVMDGIQATKEIRRMEKQNAGGFPSTPQSDGQQTPSESSTTDSRSSTTPSYRSSVIIVALTASSLQADRVAALAAGCNDFLTKPVSLEWLNNKIIEWGSIKALQMWADIRPEVVKNFSTGQAAKAHNVARRLHVPEGRSIPTVSRSRSSSLTKRQRPSISEVSRLVQDVSSENSVTSTPRIDESPPMVHPSQPMERPSMTDSSGSETARLPSGECSGRTSQ